MERRLVKNFECVMKNSGGWRRGKKRGKKTKIGKETENGRDRKHWLERREGEMNISYNFSFVFISLSRSRSLRLSFTHSLVRIFFGKANTHSL